MALAAKHKNTNTHHHKKRQGLHQRRSSSFMKTYWPYIPMLIIVLIGLSINGIWTAQAKRAVLGYATDMSASQLFQDTNSQRSSNNLSALSTNSALNAAAQAKANDMVSKDYWAHNSPSGDTPWTFITNAGYKYQAAGENLAYGFDNSSDTITGWMNSAEHRANILNSNYVDVGFGIANSPNYVGDGPETVVVAMYGKPVPVTPAPTPIAAPTATPKVTPAAIQPKTTSSPSIATNVPASTPTSSPSPASSPVKTNPPATNIQTPTTKIATLPEPPSRQVARIQVITSGAAPWSMFAISSLAVCGLAIFLINNARRWQSVFVRSERFIAKHVMIDSFLLTLVMVGFILSRTAGVIR